VLPSSGVSLQHSQSASPPDIGAYNENLGLPVVSGHHSVVSSQTASVTDHTRAPEPPPTYDGPAGTHSRAHNDTESDQSAADVRRVTDRQRAAESGRLYNGDDRRLTTSPNVSAQFTSDISLASSSLTTYEDNGRQKVR